MTQWKQDYRAVLGDAMDQCEKFVGRVADQAREAMTQVRFLLSGSSRTAKSVVVRAASSLIYATFTLLVFASMFFGVLMAAIAITISSFYVHLTDAS